MARLSPSAFFLAAFCAAITQPTEAGARSTPYQPLRVASERKVLLIGLDGLRPDRLVVASTPNIDALIAAGAYADDAHTNSMPTISGPGWSDILTGVDNAKHGVTDNLFSEPIYFDLYPSFLDRLERVNPSYTTVAIFDWPAIQNIFSDEVDTVTIFDGDSLGYDVADQLVADEAARVLADEDPDAIFAYFGEIDIAGHVGGGMSQLYLDAIEAADGYIAQMVVAIQSRPTFADEDWLIQVATDHGHLDGGGHGGSQPEVTTIILLASGPLMPQGLRIPFPTGNIDHAPTALAYLLGSIDPDWDLDGEPIGITQDQATHPQPADGSARVPLDATLSWFPGEGALSNDVYFGTNPKPGPDEFRGNQADSTFDPGPLLIATDYYWRIDTVTSSGTVNGEVWSFRTSEGGVLLAQWLLNEGQGTTAHDRVAQFDGSLIDMSPDDWVTSDLPPRVALNFDGHDDGWVQVDHESALRPPDEVTVTAWVLPDSFSEWAGIAGYTFDTSSTESGYYLHLMSGGRFGWAVAVQGRGMPYLASPGGQLPGRWYHLAGTFDGTTLRLYLDGAPQAAATASGPIDWSPIPLNGFTIGRFADDNEDIRFDGMLSDIRVWDYALGESEIAALAELGPCEPCDMDCDGEVNSFDIEPFLELLFDPNATPCDACTGDVNADGNVDAFDIEPFLECLFP